MVIAWSSTEVIRYTFYAFNLVGMNPYVLLWLRYTTFYILYPVGASSEAFLTFATLPKSSSGWFNGWNSTDYVRLVLFAIWWPGMSSVYSRISLLTVSARTVHYVHLHDLPATKGSWQTQDSENELKRYRKHRGYEDHNGI